MFKIKFYSLSLERREYYTSIAILLPGFAYGGAMKKINEVEERENYTDTVTADGLYRCRSFHALLLRRWPYTGGGGGGRGGGFHFRLHPTEEFEFLMLSSAQ